MSRTLPLADVHKWADKLELPGGLTCYLTSPEMRGAARFLQREIFHHKRYARPGFEIRPADTVVDIGANMGMFVLWAAPQANRGRVLAVEPTSVADCLRANVVNNGLNHVTIVQAAVGKGGEELELKTYPDFNIVTHQSDVRPAWFTRLLMRALYRQPKCEPVVERARCMSLGSLLDEHRIDTVDYLKVDCEGGEYEMFRGMSPGDWRRIRRLALEFHELAPGQDHRELVETLRSQGFIVQVRRPLLDYYLMKYGEIWAKKPS